MHDSTAYQRLCLELSLKPFRAFDAASIRRTAELLMRNWAPLATSARELSVLLWVGDGSEILEWGGDLSAPIPWSQSIGFCNFGEPGAYDQTVRHYRINQAVPFVASPPIVRYRDLARIIQGLRRAARNVLNRPLRVGATVDPGPEFARSDFRFRWHPEVLTPELLPSMPMRFITHQATLHADARRYGAYPDGIPEGTRLGTFLGRQFSALSRVLGLDYLWLSNGFGYTHYPWGPRGELFRGRTFEFKRAAAQLRAGRAFWTDLREACPTLSIEVRGTNYSVGMDLASDGCSHADIADIGRLERPPCNPPWGSRALGLEIVSTLSRFAKTRTRLLPYRFYLNDPWFVTNPWYDYYNREPFDLYVPMALARMNARGGVDTPSDVSLLTVNTDKGELPTGEAQEVLPHLRRALAERADAPGPVVWVYPFDEYDAILKRTPLALGHVFHQDWFFCQAVNAGFPAGTVCSSDRLTALAAAGPLPEAVWVAPVPRGHAPYARALLRWVRRGGRVLLYGALDKASPALLEALGLTLVPEGLEGEFAMDVRLHGDRFAQAPKPPFGDSVAASLGLDGGASPTPTASGVSTRQLRHRAEVDGGGLRAVIKDWSDPALRVVAKQGRARRVYALCRRRPAWGGGCLAWIWGSTGLDPTNVTVAEGRFDQPWEAQLAADWPRHLLAELGLVIRQERQDETVKPASLVIKRHQGAWYFVGHKPNTSVRFWVRTPHGAPVYAESETPIRGGCAGESFHKTIYNEVRAFVSMPDGIVRCKELAIPRGKRRHLCIEGLVQADVVLFPHPSALRRGGLRITGMIAGEQLIPFAGDAERGTARVQRYTGDLYVVW